jgi:hypothetical protein
LFFQVFGHIFERKKKDRKEFEIFFLYSLSGILYEPSLLLDAPINAHFASFPAGVCGDQVRGAERAASGPHS